MPKTRNAPATLKRRKKILKKAKGYFGNNRDYSDMQKMVERAGKYAYRDRRKKKTEFRQLWIVRINAICRANDINYSRFIHGLKSAGIENGS